VAELRQHARLEDVISLADEALYASKSKGKDLTTLADTAFIIKSQNNQNNLTVEDLLAGIKAQEFQLYIQPICDNASGKATGFEGLMRWHRPDGSIVFPGRFLELAVSPAVYPKFLDFYTSQVIPIAIALAKKNPNYYFSFNTEATFIQSSQLVEKFISKLSGLPMLHGNLVLELPEKTAILNPKTALKNIMLLQENGIKIALDDFGMEHSNMDRIRDIPADIVKIDRSFISKIDQNPRSLAIVNALVSMAKQLDFLIIAEGIETQAQAITLAASGVSRAQGYYYGHPKPVDYWLEQIQIGHI
jgi:cyclic di-GMP phosphodiesterase Gmr